MHDSDWCLGVWEDEAYKMSTGIVPPHHWSFTPGECSSEDSINLLELWPIVAAAFRWSKDWVDKKVVIYTDNTQVQAAINTGRSRSVRSMWWLRELFWYSVVFNFHLVARRVTTGDNIVADYFSRYFDPKLVSFPPFSFLSHLCCYR